MRRLYGISRYTLPSGGGSEPGLSVTGRADGEAYTVSAGARSLTISNPDGAVLSTTVELASDGSAVTVTDSTTTSPSWTAPSGGTDGDAVAVLVSATKDGLSSSVGFAERVAGTGGGGSGRSWQVYKTFDFKNGVSQGPHTATSGNVTYVLTEATGSGKISVVLRGGVNNGTIQLINGKGLDVEGVNNTGGVVGLAFLLSEEIPDLDYEWLCSNPMCVQVVLNNYDIQADDFSGFIAGINNTTSYTSGKLRSLFFQARTGTSTEQRSIRTNGSNTAIAALSSLPPAKRRMDFVLTDGDRMSANVYDGVGEADPATDFFDLSGNFLQCGSWGLPRNTSSTVYTTNMRLIFGVVQKMKCTIESIRILQYKEAP